MTRTLPLLLVALSATALEAQQAATPPTDPIVTAVRNNYNATKRFLVASAELMPEADYGFKPVETVRSFGQLLGHVANSQLFYCGSSSGLPRPEGTQGQDFEKLTTKAELIAALKKSFDYCDQAYAITDARALELTAGNNPRPRLNALVSNATHNFEHYGNIVTYLRIKGLVPPSSQ